MYKFCGFFLKQKDRPIQILNFDNMENKIKHLFKQYDLFFYKEEKNLTLDVFVNDLPKDFGLALKKIIVSYKKLNLSNVATLLNINRSRLSDWTLDKVHPTLKSIISLAVVLELEPIIVYSLIDRSKHKLTSSKIHIFYKYIIERMACDFEFLDIYERLCLFEEAQKILET